LLGKATEFEGKLSFEGTVRVDGKLTGEISQDVLIVANARTSTAKISVGSIIIEGQVRGNVTAKRSVEIHRPGRVNGNQYAIAFCGEGCVFRWPLPNGIREFRL